MGKNGRKKELARAKAEAEQLPFVVAHHPTKRYMRVESEESLGRPTGYTFADGFEFLGSVVPEGYTKVKSMDVDFRLRSAYVINRSLREYISAEALNGGRLSVKPPVHWSKGDEVDIKTTLTEEEQATMKFYTESANAHDASNANSEQEYDQYMAFNDVRREYCHVIMMPGRGRPAGWQPKDRVRVLKLDGNIDPKDIPKPPEGYTRTEQSLLMESEGDVKYVVNHSRREYISNPGGPDVHAPKAWRQRDKIEPMQTPPAGFKEVRHH